jgi:hypothetical protein
MSMSCGNRERVMNGKNGEALNLTNLHIVRANPRIVYVVVLAVFQSTFTAYVSEGEICPRVSQRLQCNR